MGLWVLVCVCMCIRVSVYTHIAPTDSTCDCVRGWALLNMPCGLPMPPPPRPPTPLFVVCCSPVEVYFATASMDRTARLWSCDSVYPIRVFAGHNSAVDVRSIVVTPCGPSTPPPRPSPPPQAVQFHPNCNYLATGSSDRTCRLWDVQSGQCVRLFSGTKVGGEGVGPVCWAYPLVTPPPAFHQVSLVQWGWAEPVCWQ